MTSLLTEGNWPDFNFLHLGFFGQYSLLLKYTIFYWNVEIQIIYLKTCLFALFLYFSSYISGTSSWVEMEKWVHLVGPISVLWTEIHNCPYRIFVDTRHNNWRDVSIIYLHMHSHWQIHMQWWENIHLFLKMSTKLKHYWFTCIKHKIIHYCSKLKKAYPFIH